MANDERATTKPLTGTVFYILLALADGERYGLGIAEEIERRTDGDMQIGPGTLYNAVKKMLATGVIVETPGPDAVDDNDPRRRYYAITEAGRVALDRETARLERLVRAAKAKRAAPAKS